MARNDKSVPLNIKMECISFFWKAGNNLVLISSEISNKNDTKKALAGKNQAKAYLSMF
ncbi:hypothetical protein [Pantoea phytobeneficialis]|uniref:hypothetical protein n=1 Tax=Pantoea phytobeneficialis TaxID=2052056 RepID=UPI0026E179B1|nr:hypothetical protein [Pantoea phytobeneficialis]